MDIKNQMDQLKNMAAKHGSHRDATVAAQPPKDDEKSAPKNLQEYLERINRKIVKIRHFRSSKIDDYGRVYGVKEYEPGKYPHVHQDLHYDSIDRVIKIELFERDFPKPVTHLYFYEEDSDKISESVWLDRYGRIDNIHRYLYNSETGLMSDRAEYNKEGEIFYQVHSEYDCSFEPPRQTQDICRDKAGNQVLHFVYLYDDNGRLTTEEHLDETNRLAGYYNFHYNQKGENILKKEWCSPDNVVRSYFSYVYDTGDNITQVRLFDSSTGKETRQEFQYDGMDNLIDEKWYDSDNNLIKHLKY